MYYIKFLNLNAIRNTQYAIQKEEEMLDIKLIRSNPEKVKEALKKRKEKINLDEILAVSYTHLTLPTKRIV